ncbi:MULTISPECIES: glycoside hydrolase family 5 protein [unclassified Yoonia]|uniref:glycoside hydrolase family 5 protein n=1 Tax=unclassified Yoonia TaxID=2629118 RepID=UPI002AFEFA3C|nr:MULTISPECIES: glycoside hydrolase family 5 protein [unclassified Yoonia]
MLLFIRFCRIAAGKPARWLSLGMVLISGIVPTPAAPQTESFPVNRCVNIGNVLDAPFEGAWGPAISPFDLDWIAGAGFDTIRLPVRFGAHWNGMIWPGFLARVEQVIGQAQDRGLTVILDLHHFDELMDDPDTYAPVFVEIWTELAHHFADHDNRLIFELLNEPRNQITTQRAISLYEKVLPIIRDASPNRWVIIGGGNMNNRDEMRDLPDFGPRIALTFHYYDPYPFTHQQSTWTAESFPPLAWGSQAEIANVQADIALARRADVPIFLGEFGVVREADTKSRNAWVKTVRQAAEENGISWCYWAYGAGFDLRDFGGYEWYPGLFAALMQD